MTGSSKMITVKFTCPGESFQGITSTGAATSIVSLSFVQQIGRIIDTRQVEKLCSASKHQLATLGRTEVETALQVEDVNNVLIWKPQVVFVQNDQMSDLILGLDLLKEANLIVDCAEQGMP